MPLRARRDAGSPAHHLAHAALHVSIPTIRFATSAAADFDDRWGALVAAIEAAGARVFVDGASELPVARPLPELSSPISPACAAAALVLRARWEEAPPDVVIATGLDVLPAVALARAGEREVRVVATIEHAWEQIRGAGLGWRLGSRAARFAERARYLSVVSALGCANRTIVLNAAAHRSWRALGVADERSTLLDSGWGIDASLLERARLSPLVIREAEGLRVGVLGSASEREGLAIALAARGLSASVVALRERGEALLGYDAVVSFETSSPHAVQVQEAMAFGRPVIAARAPAHEGVVRHRETGVLFSPGDLDSAARGVAAVSDPAVRRRVGELAQSLAARILDRDLAVEKVLRMLDGLLNGEEPTPAALSPGGRVVSGTELL